MNFKYLFIFLALGIGLFTSCEKENLETNTVEEEEVIPEMVVCSLSLSIVRDPGGSLTATAADGTTPYAYDWSTGENTAVITVSVSGTYDLTVTDSQGCTTTDSITVNIVDPCSSLSNIITETPPGTLNANPTGGTLPYAYSWSTGQTDQTITVTTSGTYSVTVTDSQGCMVSNDITVNLVDPCQGFFAEIVETVSGELITTVSGGIPPYTYAWSDGTTGYSIPQPTTGIYEVTVTDSQGCISTDAFLVVANNCQSLALSFDYDALGMSLKAEATGGTAPYAYTWATGENTSTISVSSGNTYTVNIIDAEGCNITDSFTVP